MTSLTDLRITVASALLNGGWTKTGGGSPQPHSWLTALFWPWNYLECLAPVSVVMVSTTFDIIDDMFTSYVDVVSQGHVSSADP
jgi:hypothetical protein